MDDGQFSKYNQAVLAEDQYQELQESKSNLIKEKAELQESKSNFKKELKTAVITNENYSFSKVKATKKQFKNRETELTTAENKLNEAENKFNQYKSGVVTLDYLESSGYEKQVTSDKIIYYKTDTYYQSDKDRERKNKSIFRKEEYIFSPDGTPIFFARRNDYQDGRIRKVNETQDTTFTNGIVSKYREYDLYERSPSDAELALSYYEEYDTKGRITKIIKYKDTVKDEQRNFDYDPNSDAVSIYEKDYYKLNQSKETTSKISNIYDVTDNKTGVTTSRTLYNDGSFTDTPKSTEVHAIKLFTDSNTGIKTEDYFSKDDQLIKSVTYSPLETKSPTKSYSSYFETIPKSNNNNNKSNIPQFDNIIIPISETQQRNQKQTITQQQLLGRGQSTQGSKFVLSFDSPKSNEINLNPLRVLTAPYQLANKVKSYTSEIIGTSGKNIIDDSMKLKNNIKERGGINFANDLIEGTLKSAATDPFGFISEGVVLGGVGKGAKSAINSVKQSSVKINPIEFKTKSVNIETAYNKQGLGVEVIETTGKVEVTSGLLKKKNEIVDVNAQGIINKETRVFGTKESDVTLIKKNSLSTEITPTEFIAGEMKVSVKGKTSSVNIDGIKQGNKQILNAGKETFMSETKSVGKLNNENIFRTRTENLKTNDVQITLSKNVKSKGTTLPTKEAFASGSISQTDTFISGKPIAKPKEKIINAELSSKKDIIKPLLEQKPAPIKIIVKDNSKLTLNTKPKAEFNNDLSFKPQTYAFKEKTATKQTTYDLSKNKEAKINNFEKEIKTTYKSSTNIPISNKIIKDTLKSNSNKIKFIPPKTSNSDLINSDSSGFSFDKLKDISPSQKTNSDSDFSFKRESKTNFDVDNSFKRSFDFDSKQSQHTSQKNIFRTPKSPSPPSNVPINPAFKTNVPKPRGLSFGQGSGIKTKDFNFDQLKDGGQYISSLGGALTGKYSKNPTKDNTGLRFRAILLSNGRKNNERI